MPTSKQISKPNALVYNVTWTDRVFRSSAITEALLAPEHEVGNLTTNDYNASLHFLPGYHRYYPILGCIGASAFILLRSPAAKWTQRRALTTFTLGFTGYTLGKFAMLNAHYNYVRSLENPAGFSKAMENVQAKIGGPVPPGFIIERAYGPLLDEQNHTFDITSNNTPGSQQSDQHLDQGPVSKWEQIRKMNDNTAKNSTWEIIRQQHERSSGASKPSSVERDSELFWDDSVNSDVDTAQ